MGSFYHYAEPVWPVEHSFFAGCPHLRDLGFNAAHLALACTLIYKVLMKAKVFAIAAGTELLLIFPAVLFMAALFVRNIQPLQYEPAHTAQQIVNWYAARLHIGLWGLLIGMPLIVLVTGFSIVFHKWRSEPELRQAAGQTFATLTAHLETVLIALATLVAGGVLAIVALHLLAD